MPSSPLDNTHGRMTSGEVCPHRPWTARRSDDVGCGMPTWALGSIKSRTTLGVTCHQRPWVAHIVGLCRPWYARMVLGKYTESNDIECCMSPSLLRSTHNRMTLGVECHHRPREEHIIERRHAWYSIIAHGKHTSLDDVGRGMTSLP